MLSFCLPGILFFFFFLFFFFLLSSSSSPPPLPPTRNIKNQSLCDCGKVRWEGRKGEHSHHANENKRNKRIACFGGLFHLPLRRRRRKTALFLLLTAEGMWVWGLHASRKVKQQRHERSVIRFMFSESNRGTVRFSPSLSCPQSSLSLALKTLSVSLPSPNPTPPPAAPPYLFYNFGLCPLLEICRLCVL